MNQHTHQAAPDYSVLIVDDDPLNRELLTRRLQNDGYMVTACADGKQAIEYLGIERFQVLLLDLNMPEMNGFDVLEWLQKHKQNAMRIIMLTAEGDRDAVNACLTLGADDYVLKSAGLVELLYRMKRACLDSQIENQLGALPKNEEWKNTQILLVDDNAISLQLMLRRFQQFDIKSYIANDGQAALELIEQTCVDLVLLDYQMPDLNGLEVLQQIRARRSREQLGVVMVTAESDPDVIAQLFEAGANDYIAKPFHAIELLNRAHNVLLDMRLRQKQLQLTDLANLGKQFRSQDI